MLKIVSFKEFITNGVEKYLPRVKSRMENITTTVQSILDNVKTNKDQAIIKYTLEFDKVSLKPSSIRVTQDEIKNAYNFVPADLIDALKKASNNIKKFHEAQIRSEWSIETMKGVKTGQVLRPLESVGMYVPGGKAVYPSTVLMTAIPAKVAGVEKLILCSPPGNFEFEGKKYVGINPSILVAANESGVKDIFKVGGAQAIAAMAYGTETIPSVLKIIGPGNKYVNAAKILVKDIVSIDSPAGPSEVAIIADENANPVYIAYDLLSQVEHDPDNVGVVISDSKKQINDVLVNVMGILNAAPRKEIMMQSLKSNGIIIQTSNLEESIQIANLIAPEHLEILTKNYKEVLPKIRNAGAIFLGSQSPVPLGDYSAGTNHVLPTDGNAKRYSGLNTLDFMKQINTLECTNEGLTELEKILSPIAEFEGLFGHRDAVRARLQKKEDKK